MKTLSKTRTVGGSIMVTIPKRVAELEGIRGGETVSIDVKKIKKSLFGAAKGVGPFTAEDEMKGHD